jgi:hypothetical protein
VSSWSWAQGDSIRGADRIGLYLGVNGSWVIDAYSRGRLPFITQDGLELVAPKDALDRLWQRLGPSGWQI